MTRCTCLTLAAISTAYHWLHAVALTTQVGTFIDASAAPDPTVVTDEAAAQERAILDARVAELEKSTAAAEEEAQKARANEKEAWYRVEAARSATQTEETKLAVANAGSTQRTLAINEDLQHVLEQAQYASLAHRDAEELARAQMEKKLEQTQATADAINKDTKSASFHAGAYAQHEADEEKLKELRAALEHDADAASDGYEIQSKVNELASKAGNDVGEFAVKYDPKSATGLRVAEVLSEAALSTDALNKLQDEVNSTRAA